MAKTGERSYDEFCCSRALSLEVDELCMNSCISDPSYELDLECGSPDVKVNLEKNEKDCRICQLSLESNTPESGISIVLGCSCKDDLAVAHKQCAETWFKIKGNKTCEICGSTAKNVFSVEENESVENPNETSSNLPASVSPNESRSFWQGHRFLNILLGCVIFAFVVSWLFRFNVPS